MDGYGDKAQEGRDRLIIEHVVADEGTGDSALGKARTQLLVMCGYALLLPRPRLHGPPRGRPTMDSGEEED